MFLYYLLSLLIAICYYVYTSLKKKTNYWKDRGVPQLKPDLIYGDTKRQVLQEISTAEIQREFYNEFKQRGCKYGGIYGMLQPMLLVIDPDIIRLILVKDFQHFSAHNPILSTTAFFNNLFHMDGEPWKDMRRKLTPTFTSGKMKMMFDILLQKTLQLQDLVVKMTKTGESAEIKQLLARYTTDVIGTVGFGIECDSMNDPNSVFFTYGQNLFKKIFHKKMPSTFIIMVFLLLRSLGVNKRFRLSFDLAEEENYFRDVVIETVKYREENKISRKDFLHLMIQLKNKGSITDILNEKDIFKSSGDSSYGISMEDLVGQCLLFISAGFETTSTTMSFALLELTQNQDVQNKIREEVRRVLKKHDDKLTYDSLQEMPYLDSVIQETLRKYPPLATLPRLCTKNYTIPNSDVVIEKGTFIQIPLLAIQNDPDYFYEPNKFIPERFSLENRKNIIDYTYLPFGEGPRQCLGLRFGMMQAKAGLATLINRFSFTLNQKTTYPPKFHPASPILSVQGGIWLDAKEVK